MEYFKSEYVIIMGSVEEGPIYLVVTVRILA